MRFLQTGMKPVTMADIAARAGVSRATVSRALSGNPAIAASTRARIQALASELGWRADAVLKDPAIQVRGPLRNCLYLDYRPCPEAMRQVACEAAQQHGLQLQIDTLQAEELPFLPERLQDQGHAGIILNGPALFHYPLLTELDWPQLPVVLVGPCYGHHRFHHVTHDVLQRWLRCHEQARRLGYRRIAIICYRHDQWLPDDYLHSGICMALSDSMSAADRIPPYLGHFEDPMDQQVDWLAEQGAEVAILRHAGPWHALRERGWNLPVLAAGWAGRHFDTDFSGSHSDPQELWNESCALLRRLIALGGRATRPFSINLRDRWHPGSTCPTRQL